ncbi:MAG: RluA family pseudouridine synthase, partial [Pirellulales bacterium]
LRVRPKTGRTHQIRVHLASIGHPVLCDRLYGGRCRVTVGELTGHQADERVLLCRQALHARFLTFVHPATGASMRFEAPLPQDIELLLGVLREGGADRH